MNGGGERVVALPFYVSVVVGGSDDVSTGPVWVPGIVESLRVQASVAPVVLQARADPNPAPLLTGGLFGLPIGGEFIWRVPTDSPFATDRSGYWVLGTDEREVLVGRVVAFAPWWLVVRVLNVAAAAASVYGTFKVVLRAGLSPGEWVERVNGRRAEDPRARFLGRNPYRRLRGVS